MLAKASCVSQILTARAVTSEFGADASNGTGLLPWARIRENNSERDVQKVVAKQKLKLPIPIEHMVCGSVVVPWINPKEWLRYILNHNLWCRVCGLEPEQSAFCQPIWKQFWQTYKILHPSFDLFSIPGIDLSRTAAFFIHGDEGRGLKKTAYMTTNLHCALGHGSQPQSRKHGDLSVEGTFRLKLNHLKNTYLTRFISILMPKAMYENQATSDLYMDMLDELGKSLDDILMSGMCGPDGHRYRICIIGVKGDLPYLSRVSYSERAYNRASRGGTKGICHLCAAGQPNVQSEEVGSRTPRWLSTEGAQVPWVVEPPLSRWLCSERTSPAAFYKLDIWHTFHLGVGRSFIASTIVLCMSLAQFASRTIDSTFDKLSESYLAFCRETKQQPHIRRIHRDFVCYNDPGGVNGYWNKGALTTVLMLWLEHMLGALGLNEGSIFWKALLACRHVNNFFRCLYHCDAFLNADQCAYAAQAGRGFLIMYVDLATACHEARRSLYPLIPKIHFLDHFMVRLHWDGVTHGISENPLMCAVQMDEDIVGKLSRLSRRVSIRLQIRRTFDRYLMACHGAFENAQWI